MKKRNEASELLEEYLKNKIRYSIDNQTDLDVRETKIFMDAIANMDATYSEIEMRDDERESRVRERELKHEFDKHEVTCKYLDVAGKIVVPAVQVALTLIMFKGMYKFYGEWLKIGMAFEESGSFTSKTFAGLAKEFVPKRLI